MTCRCCGRCRKIPLVDPLTGLANGLEICPLCDTVPRVHPAEGTDFRAGPPNAGYV